MKFSRYLPQALVAFSFLCVATTARSQEKKGWWNADRSSIGITPKAVDEPRAIVQIYAARAYSWRGHFAVHSWISIKEQNAASYTTYQVMGFGVSRGIPVINTHNEAPDRRWFGSDPVLLLDLRGPNANALIPEIKKSVGNYPYPDFYRLWPGPNSNTFVSHVIRNTPGIYVELPPHAIGKDWIGTGDLVGFSESGTGLQFSVLGVLGITLGIAEGLEINILGMTFGIDFLRPALKLPFVGRLGFSDSPVFFLQQPGDQ